LRVLLISLLVVAAHAAACTSEGDRVYAEARRCAESIARGDDCPARQNARPGEAQPTPAAGPDTPDGTQARAAAAQEARVYIDASESMKGFVSAPDSNFVKVIEALGYAMPGCRLYKYGVGGRAAAPPADGELPYAHEIRFSQELRSPGFYNLGFNEDDVLIKHLVEEERPARSVILTDGVYSARNTELQSEVVKAIGNWMSKGRFLGILIFTSPFEGKLYSENARNWTDKVNVSARPFYAYVFSPDEKGFRELREQLSGEVKILGSLSFPGEAVTCTVRPVDQDGLEHKDVPPRSPFYLHMYGASIFGGRDQAELLFDLRCTPAPGYPVGSFKLDVTPATYTWQQDSFRKNEKAPQPSYTYAEPEPAQSGPSPTPEPAGSDGHEATTPTPGARARPNLRVKLERDGGSSHSLYHLMFNLSVKALDPEIRDLSTPDDSLTSEAGKTYRFYEFISSLTAMHLQGKGAVKLPPPVLVAVANR
jgi:hypothetical protein